MPGSLPLRIAGGAVRIVRDEPRLIGTWAVLLFAEALASVLLLRPTFDAMRAAAAGGAAVLAEVWPAFAALYLLTAIVLVVLFAGAMRVVLRPEERRWAYLRLGGDELRLLLLGLIVGGGLYVATMAGMVAIIVVASLVSVLAGQVSGFVLAAVLAPLALIGLLYCAARLAPAAALTLLRGRITLRPAWRLTRGRGWALLGDFALVGLVCIAATLVLLVPMALLEPGWVFPGPADTARLAEAMDMATSLSPGALALRVLGAVVGAVTAMLPGAAVAVATRALAEERGEPL